jgi:hypothetical protein
MAPLSVLQRLPGYVRNFNKHQINGTKSGRGEEGTHERCLGVTRLGLLELSYLGDMGGKSGCFTVQNEVISEKWMAIKKLKGVIPWLPGVFLRWRGAKGRSLGQGRCVS